MTSAHLRHKTHIKRLVLLILLILLIGFILSAVYRQTKTPSNLTRSTLTDFSKLPTYDQDNQNRPSDPINVVVIGSEKQLTEAFTAAHWVKAEPITPFSIGKIILYSGLSLYYQDAPISSQYLFGRVQDLAFQKPGRNINTRDHIRIWDSGYNFEDGRKIWVAAATYDNGLTLDVRNYFIPTHSISPDVDKERELVLKDLQTSPEYSSEISYQAQVVQKNLRLGSNTVNTDGVVKVLLFN